MALHLTIAGGRALRALPLALAGECLYVGRTLRKPRVTPDTLRHWLLQHRDDIWEFADLDPHRADDLDLEDLLAGAWFRDDAWNEPGYRFIPLAADGSGGLVAAWLRSDADPSPSVVFFGSEGGAGVLASSPLAFARALAYAPVIEEYHNDDFALPAYLALGESPLAESDRSREALFRYRQGIVQAYGELPTFARLVVVPTELQAEFCTWVRLVCDRAEAREEREHLLAREARHRVQRQKAETHASNSALLPEQVSLRDGTQLRGTCAACRSSSTVRLTRFEELAFVLCPQCYFSNAW